MKANYGRKIADIKYNKENKMSLNKQNLKNVNVDKKLNCNSMFIKISHYEEDKLLKTETFPMIHFLEAFESEFKKVRYN
ncbi:MAG: hypothetical protein CMP38_00825 [Rickettsiales bacterium]|nr:hypothetical protein [Rickettsiales bacterium]